MYKYTKLVFQYNPFKESIYSINMESNTNKVCDTDMSVSKSNVYKFMYESSDIRRVHWHSDRWP